jgi:hypothetical protein
VESGQWFIKCILAFVNANDPYGASRDSRNFLSICKAASPADQAKLKAMWDEAGLPPFPEPAVENPPAM